jgi:hypothetical protein
MKLPFSGTSAEKEIANLRYREAEYEAEYMDAG